MTLVFKRGGGGIHIKGHKHARYKFYRKIF